MKNVSTLLTAILLCIGLVTAPSQFLAQSSNNNQAEGCTWDPQNGWQCDSP